MSRKTETGPISSDEFEWEPVQSTRPHIRVGVTILVVIGLLAMVTLIPAGSAGAQTTEFNAQNVTVQTNSGNLQEVTVAPNGTVEYWGFEQEPDNVTAQVEVKKSGASSWDTVNSTELVANGSGMGLEGNLTYDLARDNLITQSSLTKSDFKASEGSTSETDIVVRVTVTFAGAGASGSDVNTSSQATFTVTVENLAAGGGVGGNANTDANGN